MIYFSFWLAGFLSFSKSVYHHVLSQCQISIFCFTSGKNTVGLKVAQWRMKMFQIIPHSFIWFQQAFNCNFPVCIHCSFVRKKCIAKSQILGWSVVIYGNTVTQVPLIMCTKLMVPETALLHFLKCSFYLTRSDLCPIKGLLGQDVPFSIMSLNRTAGCLQVGVVAYFLVKGLKLF